MKLEGKGTLLRIFIGEADSLKHTALSDALLSRARELGLAGCTISRGIAGFGANSRIVHTAKLLALSEDLPLILEIVDTEENIKAFLPEVERLFDESNCGALVTSETVNIIHYSPKK